MLLRERAGRSLLDYRIVAAYLIGTTEGALLTAAAAWVLSGLTEPLGSTSRMALLALGAAFVWACKHGPLAGVITLPEARRQIPAQVFGGSLVRGAHRFGLELGTGMRTYVPSAAPYVLLLFLVVGRPTLAAALLAGVGFGVARAVPLAARLLAPHHSRLAPASLRRMEPFASTFATLLILAGALRLV